MDITLRKLIRSFVAYAEQLMVEGRGPMDTRLFFSSFPKVMPQDPKRLMDLLIQLAALLLAQFFNVDEEPKRKKAA